MNPENNKEINFISKMAENGNDEGTFALNWTIRAILICILLLHIKGQRKMQSTNSYSGFQLRREGQS